MLGRIMRSADFELVLATPAKARSAHFSAHHVSVAPSRPAKATPKKKSCDLSTVSPAPCAQVVEDFARATPNACWFGAVVPKRHARRAATRNLVKRQIRSAMIQHEPGLARGLWLVRLRAPLDTEQFVSANSLALRTATREELDALLARARV